MKREKMLARLLFLVFILSFHRSVAQVKFEINNGSEKYVAEITVENCKEGLCEGKGIIRLFAKKDKQLIQNITSGNLFFYLDSNQKPSVNTIQLYEEQSPLIFDDFNFDGTEDIAVRNGNMGSYDGPSYDVYVFHSTKKQFVFSKELTKLASENLGMFETDKKRKRLITYNKSGCCWHITTEYKVVPKVGLQKVYELEEDAQGGDDKVIVITRTRVKNKWVVKTKKYKQSEYYKN